MLFIAPSGLRACPDQGTSTLDLLKCSQLRSRSIRSVCSLHLAKFQKFYPSVSQWGIQEFPDGGCQPLNFGQKHTIWQDFCRKLHEQECIPVGCIPPAAVAIWGGLHQAPPRTDTPQSRHPQTRYPLPEQTPNPPGTRHPPVNRMTNRCKNITLPQTSFAGCKNERNWTEGARVPPLPSDPPMA